MTMGNGRTVTLPPGSPGAGPGRLLKRRSGGQLTAEETATLDKVRQAGGAGGRGGSGANEGVLAAVHRLRKRPAVPSRSGSAPGSPTSTTARW